MNMGLALRPANEDLRAQTVVKTGLIDAPTPICSRYTVIWPRTSPALKPVSASMTVK